jgi:hypothetical protein
MLDASAPYDRPRSTSSGGASSAGAPTTGSNRSPRPGWLAPASPKRASGCSGLALAQEDLALLPGASRQRVTQELKGFEREGAVRVEPTRLVVLSLSREKLLAISER